MSMQPTKSSLTTIVTTAVLAALVTLGVVAIILTSFGTEKVSEEISPFVNSAKERLTEGVVPPSERTEPKTDGDLILEAVANNTGNSVQIYQGVAQDETFVARGLMIATDGTVITDAAAVQASTTYMVRVPGTRDPLPAQKILTTDGLTVLKIDIKTTLVSQFTDGVPTTESLVVALNGAKELQIATGIITAVSDAVLSTNIVGTMVPGTPLVAKDGSVIGIATVSAQTSAATDFKRLSQEYHRTLLADVNSI